MVPVVNFVFLNDPRYKKYRGDLVFDKLNIQIIKSRMYLELSPKGRRDRYLNFLQMQDFYSRALVSGLLEMARKLKLPVTIRASFAFSLHHDMQVS